MDWDRWNELKSDHRLWFSSFIFCTAVLLIWTGFGALAIALCLSCLFLGSQLANWIALDSNGQLLSVLIDYWVVFEQQPANENEKKEKENCRRMPWEGIQIPTDLNESLENLFEHIINQYVANWYSTGIGQDQAFLNEIRYQLRYGCAQFVNTLKKISLHTIVTDEAFSAASLHIHKITQITKTFTEKNLPVSIAENRILEQMVGDLHFSMRSRQCEINYLKQVADALIPLLLDNGRLSGRAHDDDFHTSTSLTSASRNWPSHSARHFLRELLVNSILLPLLDLIADPDTVNNMVIVAFDSYSSPCEYVLPESKISFLKGLTEGSDNLPDSLLQLKLSEILRDGRQFSMFRLYLQDVKGPVNELTFLAEATRIHESMQRKEESSSQISYDIWQLYGQFVHEGAPDQIPFDEQMVIDFKKTMQTNDMLEWDRIIEKAYQVVYQHLQVGYVIPFCQSDSFLGYLCGSPPISVIELIDKPSLPRRSLTTDRVLSFNMFRSQLRRLLTLSTEGSVEGEEVVCDEFSDSSSGNNLLPVIELEKSKSAIFEKELSVENDVSNMIPTSTSLPTIDVSEDLDTASADSSIMNEAEEELDGQIKTTPKQPQLIINDLTKNINNWKVGVTKVTPRRDEITGRTNFIYVIEVERMEAQDNETRFFSINRKFTEFYVLEAKLIEFHGDALRFSPLPPRKSFTTKNRAFLEQHRLIFSNFISALCKQKLLCRSDLLFSFFTRPDEFKEYEMLSELNPWKVVKKMPGKLSRERGQHLRPFLLNMLANNLAQADKPAFKEKFDISSESSSISSLSMAGEGLSQPLYSPLFGNNCVNCKFPEEFSSSKEDSWTKSPVDAVLLLLNDICIPLNWLGNVLFAIRLFCQTNFDRLIRNIFSYLFKQMLVNGSLVSLVQLIQQSLFYSDGTIPTIQEKSLREELMKRRVLEFIQEHTPSLLNRILGRQSLRQGVDQIVTCLQFPRLNKQLSYVLLDILLKHIKENVN